MLLMLLMLGLMLCLLMLEGVGDAARYDAPGGAKALMLQSAC